MEKFHAYIRVRTETQTVDRQKDLIQHFCESYPGVEVEYYIDEGWSGDLPRPKERLSVVVSMMRCRTKEEAVKVISCCQTSPGSVVT